MSRPRLHVFLEQVFVSKDLIPELFVHSDFKTFADKYLLSIPTKQFAQSFTHKSFSHEFNVTHQEQLEFLGDSVLQLILTEEIYKRYPNYREGQLSKLRSAIVNEKSLALVARGLELEKLIIVGKGEFKKKLFEQDTILADTFEALLAQIYLFEGYEKTRSLLISWVEEFLPNAFSMHSLETFDVKSKLQETVLAKYKKVPRYTSESIGDLFEITLWINELPVEKGTFTSKKSGEKELAELVLKKGNI